MAGEQAHNFQSFCVCANLAELNASLEILQSLPGNFWENGRYREALHVSAF